MCFFFAVSLCLCWVGDVCDVWGVLMGVWGGGRGGVVVGGFVLRGGLVLCWGGVGGVVVCFGWGEC